MAGFTPNWSRIAPSWTTSKRRSTGHWCKGRARRQPSLSIAPRRSMTSSPTACAWTVPLRRSRRGRGLPTGHSGQAQYEIPRLFLCARRRGFQRPDPGCNRKRRRRDHVRRSQSFQPRRRLEVAHRHIENGRRHAHRQSQARPLHQSAWHGVVRFGFPLSADVSQSAQRQSY